MSGECQIGAGAFVGAGAVVAPRISIGEGAVVGAGAVAIRDVGPGEVVVGNPARVLRRV
jgi:acetyltransferase-like isoleucine patch superfamily enzyme